MVRKNGLLSRALCTLAAIFTTLPDVGAGDFSKNDAVRAALREHGDDGLKLRPIDHFAYFPTSSAVAQYRDFLSTRGYVINRETTPSSHANTWGIEFSKSQAPNDIDEETERLRVTASEFGGEYDGWGTEVADGS